MLQTGGESEPGTGKGLSTEEALGEVAGVGAVTLFTCSTLNRFFPPSPTAVCGSKRLLPVHPCQPLIPSYSSPYFLPQCAVPSTARTWPTW